MKHKFELLVLLMILIVIGIAQGNWDWDRKGEPDTITFYKTDGTEEVWIWDNGWYEGGDNTHWTLDGIRNYIENKVESDTTTYSWKIEDITYKKWGDDVWYKEGDGKWTTTEGNYILDDDTFNAFLESIHTDYGEYQDSQTPSQQPQEPAPQAPAEPQYYEIDPGETSVSDVFKNAGYGDVDNFEARKEWWEKTFGSEEEYTGSDTQNLKILNALKNNEVKLEIKGSGGEETQEDVEDTQTTQPGDEFQTSNLIMHDGLLFEVDEEGNIINQVGAPQPGDVFLGEDGNWYEVKEDGSFKNLGPAESTQTEEEKKSVDINMKEIGDFLDELTYATSGYRGLTMFYSEPNWWLGYDETIMDALGGIDGWTSIACRSKITSSDEVGVAMSETTLGAFAHIEGEKIKIINYSAEEPETSYIYKISFEVSPGAKYRGCDMKFRVYVQDPRKSIFKNSNTGLPYTFSVKKGNESVSYKGQNMIFKQSKYDYEEVCIYFTKLEGNCLVGIKEGEYLCSKIVDGGEKKIDLGDDPCEVFPIMPNCWSFEWEGGTSTSSSTSSGLVGDW